MTEGTLGLFLFENFKKAKREDPLQVIQSLTRQSCRDCGLSHGSPDNPGFLYRGSPLASTAFLIDYPTDSDMRSKKAFSDGYAVEFFKWLQQLGLSEKDVFLTYIVQCKTPVKEKSKNKNEEETGEIAKAELQVCFPSRSLRVLQSMPNLRVLVCLGIPAIKAILGGEPKTKTHHGIWFGADQLPGVAVYCLPDPKTLDETTSSRTKGRIRQILEFFKTEYLGRTGVIAPGKILDILAILEKERHGSL